jgi:hypothetical protein
LSDGRVNDAHIGKLREDRRFPGLIAKVSLCPQALHQLGLSLRRRPSAKVLNRPGNRGDSRALI